MLHFISRRVSPLTAPSLPIAPAADLRAVLGLPAGAPQASPKPARAPAPKPVLPTLVRLARPLARGLWAVISVVPAIAAGVLPLVAVVAGALPALAVAVGTFACTSGLLVLLLWLEGWAGGRPGPEALSGATDALTLGVQGLATDAVPSVASGIPAAQVADVSDNHIVLRQRFVTQQMMPAAPHVRAAPMPIRSVGWERVASGAPDGMAYNWLGQKGDGAHGAMACFTLMDQMSILSVSMQNLRKSIPVLGPGEVFYGPMVGGWAGSLMALGEVGFAHAGGGRSFRVGGGGGMGRSHSLQIEWDKVAPQALDNGELAAAPQTYPIASSRIQSGWAMGSFTTNLFAHLNPVTRFDMSRQKESQWQMVAPAAEAYGVQQLLQRPAAIWLSNIKRAWGGASPIARPVPTLDDPSQLLPGESFGQTFLRRAGALAAPAEWGLSLGLSLLKQRSCALRVARSGSGVLSVTLVQQEQLSRRGFLSFTGGVGYDRGARHIVADTSEVRFDWNRAASKAAYARLVAQVRDARWDDAELRASLRALAATAGPTCAPSHRRIRGRVGSHELGTQVNIFPSEILGRYMPENFVAAAAVQGQSVRLMHERLSHGAVDPALGQTITVHHDHLRSFGPEGLRHSRTQAVLALTPNGHHADKHADKVTSLQPGLTLSHHWEMGRGDALEVQKFILEPLARLVGTGTGPLFGAGWRHRRAAVLARAFDADDLAKLCHAGPVDCAQAIAACGQDVPQAALMALIEAIRNLHSDPGAKGAPIAWNAERLGILADAFEAWTQNARLGAAVLLHALLARLPMGGEKESLLRPPAQLHLTTDASPYTDPSASLKKLQLAAQNGAAGDALLPQCDSALHEVALGRALMGSDPLLGTSQKDALTSRFDAVHNALTALKLGCQAA